ncbi:immunoglobulin-like domain-containing protein [Paenibacillus tarimensis]
MKKWVAAVAVVSLLTTGGTTVMAKGNGGKQKSEDKAIEACAKVPPGLLNALGKVKNPKARASIEKNIEKYKEKCDKEKEEQALTDAQRVERDKAALKIEFTGNDSATRVTSALKLSTKGKNGSTITWKSNNTSVISDSGQVTRPQGQDVNVVLTATVKLNSVTATKTFTLKVTANPVTLTPAQIVARDKEALQIGFTGTDTASHVTQPLKSLPAKGENGSTITWISGATAFISNDGKTVNRPLAISQDVNVVMTAIIKYENAATEVKTFQLTVKKQLADDQKVAADKAALTIDFGGPDTADKVTRPLDALPARGAEGSEITWVSSAPNILSSDGKTLNRPAVGAEDFPVVMTAFIKSGNFTELKSFSLTVKKQYTTLEKLASDKAELVIGFAEGDSASSVTKSLTLPTTLYYGSTVLWYSQKPEYISDSGKIVSRPAKGEQDVTVTLFAHISNTDVGDMKPFTVTVKAQQ